MRYFWLIFLLWPLAEIMVFMAVTDEIGIFYTLFLCFAAVLLGVALIQKGGFDQFLIARERLRTGEAPFLDLMRGMWWVIGGFLLIVPGFLSDIAAFLILLPQIQQKIRQAFANPARRAQDREKDNAVIEGTFERLDD